MNRRSFLRTAGVGGVVFGSGCAGLGDESPGDETPTRTPEPVVRIAEWDLVDGDEVDEPYVEALVENVAGRQLGEVALTVRFSVGGEVRTGRTGFVNGLSDGQQWLAGVSSGLTTVDEVELEVQEQALPAELETDHVELVDDELSRADDTVFVEGVARNVSGDRLSDAEIACNFTDGEGLVLGNALFDIVGSLGANEDHEFSILYASPVRPADDIDGYRLTADARVAD